MTEPELLTMKEVAARLGRSIRWVRKNRERIGFVREPNSRPKITREALAAYLADQAKRSAETRSAARATMP